MTDKSADATPDDTAAGTDAARKKEPETIADLREAVDQKIEDLFGDLDAETDADTDSPPRDIETRDLSLAPTTAKPGGKPAAQSPPKQPAPAKTPPEAPKKAAPPASGPPTQTPRVAASAPRKSAAPPQKATVKAAPPVEKTAPKVARTPRPAPRSAAPSKKAPPLLGRVLLWGAVLGFVACTFLYFATWEVPAPPPSTAESGILFHKIAPATLPEPSETPSKPPEATAAPQASAPAPGEATVAPYAERAYPYAIHMASFRSPTVALASAAKYGRGFQAFVVRTDLGEKGVWYRVFAGHFPDATSAVDAIKKYMPQGSVVAMTRYACLTGAFASANDAEALSARLTGKGFFPYTIHLDRGYYVMVGGNPTLGVVKALDKTLKAAGFDSRIIKR